MMNPVAVLFRPSRVFFMCLALLVGWGALLVTAQGGCEEPDDVSRVELLD